MSLSEIAPRLSKELDIVGDIDSICVPEGLPGLLVYQWRVSRRRVQIVDKFVAAAAKDEPDTQDVLRASRELMSIEKLLGAVNSAMHEFSSEAIAKDKETGAGGVSEEKTSE